MSDQNNGAAFQGAGQPPQTPVQTGGNDGQPQFLTRQEADALIKDAVESAVQRAQSLTGKAENRLRKEFQAKKAQMASATKMLESRGVVITPEIKSQLEAGLLAETLAEEQDGEPGPGQPQRQVTGADQEIADINRRAMEMMLFFFVVIEDNDEEVKLLSHKSPAAFLLSVAKAIEAKQARASLPPKAPTSAGGTGGIPPQATDQDYIQAMMGARGKGAAYVKNIREQYKAKGVDVDHIPLSP